MWHISREGSTWGAWESLGGFTTSSPAAVWQSADRLDLVARGHDDALWHRTYSGHAWQPWQRVGGDLASAPAVLSEGPGSLDVFALDEAGEVLHLPYAGAWGSWESLGGALTSAPAAALFPGGIVHLLGRGLDNAVWQAVRAGGSGEAGPCAAGCRAMSSPSCRGRCTWTIATRRPGISWATAASRCCCGMEMSCASVPGRARRAAFSWSRSTITAR